MLRPTSAPRPAQTRLNLHGSDADHQPMSQPTQASGAPDRLSIWPVEGGRYGIDASYHGVTGYHRAEIQSELLERASLRVSLRQDLGDTWTLRLGPLTHDAAWLAIEEFIGPQQ
jgi:hypothetical protein